MQEMEDSIFDAINILEFERQRLNESTMQVCTSCDVCAIPLRRVPNAVDVHLFASFLGSRTYDCFAAKTKICVQPQAV